MLCSKKKIEKMKMDFKKLWFGFVIKKLKRIEINFKKFRAFAGKPIDSKRFWVWIVSLVGVGVLYRVLTNYSKVSCWFVGVGGLDLLTFIITLAAFIAAAYAIWQQHKAGVKQEIIGAWQVLANKAAGNSGKIEAIEFLAKQGKSLQGIDMSKDTHDGQVYLGWLNVSEKELGKWADLSLARFEGADLGYARFEGASLGSARFEGADLSLAHFEGAYLSRAHFEGANLLLARFEGANLFRANFEGAYILVSDNMRVYHLCLPKTAPADPFKFEIDTEKKPERELDKEGKPTGKTKHFIRLIPKNPKQ